MPIVVPPPALVRATPPRTERLSADEARRIARAIRPSLHEYAARYERRKYWPSVYNSVLRQFGRGDRVPKDAIRDALMWKWGHLGKPTIPSAHRALIIDIQNAWSEAVADLPLAPSDAFAVLNQRFGPKRFVTIAFLLHLVRPADVPIVDQHNFRAVNWFMREVRPGWRMKGMPTRYRDLETVSTFMASVLIAWRQCMPVSVPTRRRLDRFLMMYGKALKVSERQRRS